MPIDQLERYKQVSADCELSEEEFDAMYEVIMEMTETYGTKAIDEIQKVVIEDLGHE